MPVLTAKPVRINLVSDLSEKLWEVFNEESDEFFRLNVAGILRTSDTALAYLAYREIYPAVEGYVKQQALLNIVRLRPGESTSWFLDGLQTGDWITANLAMDSLISTTHFIPGKLVDLYKQPGTSEETRWRIVFVMGHREVPESLPLLVEALFPCKTLLSIETTILTFKIITLLIT